MIQNGNNKKDQKYFLPKHVFTCKINNRYVFLDLHEDEYMCLEPEQTKIFDLFITKETKTDFKDNRAPTLQHINSQSPQLQNIEDPKNKASFLQALIDDGLLTKNQKTGKILSSTNIDQPKLDMTGYIENDAPNIKIRHFIQFIKAGFSVAFALKFLPLESVTEKLKRHKELEVGNIQSNRKPMQNNNSENIRKLTEIFKTLRLLFFTSSDNCLYDSLVLMKFLASFGIHPTWVIGVKLDPFAAHSWVQEEDTVLNDSVEHVAFFTPIMTI